MIIQPVPSPEGSSPFQPRGSSTLPDCNDGPLVKPPESRVHHQERSWCAGAGGAGVLRRRIPRIPDMGLTLKADIIIMIL